MTGRSEVKINSTPNAHILSSVRVPLERVSIALENFRRQHMDYLHALLKFKSVDFNHLQPDPRAVKPTGVFRAYLTVLEREGRTPNIEEVRTLYNTRYRKDFCKRAIKDCFILFNENRPPDMPKLTLFRENSSGVYTEQVADACLAALKERHWPSSKYIISKIKQGRAECRISASGLKRHLEYLRENGIEIRLQHGSLTKDLVRDVFVVLRESQPIPPSIGQIGRFLKDYFNISATRKSIEKMLQKIRDLAPDNEKTFWRPSRTRKAYDYELIVAYREVRRSLKEQGITRLPAVSDILRNLQERDPRRVPSHDRLVQHYARINEERKAGGRPPLRFVRQAFLHLDRIEKACFALSTELGHQPTREQIHFRVNSDAEPSLSRAAIDKGIRTLQRSPTQGHNLNVLNERESGVYDFDIIAAYNSLANGSDYRPTREEFLGALLDGHPERSLSLSGLDYRLKVLRRSGMDLKFKNSPLIRKTSAEREAERRQALQTLCAETTDIIVAEEIQREYGRNVPKHIREMRGFFKDCVFVALQQRFRDSDGRKEMRELLRVHRNIRTGRVTREELNSQ